MTRKQNPAPLGGGTGQIGGGACSTTRPGKQDLRPGPQRNPPTGARQALAGVAFWHRDIDQARAWVIAALLADCFVFRTRSREGWHFGWGWSLAQGELSEFLLSE
jgi:hypothetical protein